MSVDESYVDETDAPLSSSELKLPRNDMTDQESVAASSNELRPDSRQAFANLQRRFTELRRDGLFE